MVRILYAIAGRMVLKQPSWAGDKFLEVIGSGILFSSRKTASLISREAGGTD